MGALDKNINKESKENPFAIKEIIWIIFIIGGSIFSWLQLGHIKDIYEIWILIGTSISLIFLGRFWHSIKMLSYWVTAISLTAIWIYASYDNQISANEQSFFLKYLISSQSAMMWMSVLYIFATITYFVHLFSSSEYIGKVATFLTWSGTVAAFVGMMVRWRESYLINVDYGQIPVSTLYDAFILFIVVTAVMYLYYEEKAKTKALGGFVMLVVTAAITFLLWYTFDRDAHVIQPLVPALKSWWMKVHVPANFVGYGGFAIAAMVGMAYLIKEKVYQINPNSTFIKDMPSREVMDDLMYKPIAIGFAFFTIATVLGAMWAAEAWGGYWSWDPKETWALIVWLNYAAWLHIRLTKGWSGTVMAWWAVVGLFITTFAFIGVNIFLSGLHSYGEL